MPGIFHSLIDVSTAKKLASEAISIDAGSESVPVEAALGRVLAEDIVSPMNSPPFNRSIKDGYAVRSGDTWNASEKLPSVLEVKGRIDIGGKPSFAVDKGSCLYIPTGAVMPEGADSVVMVEYTREEDGRVSVYRPSRKGENVALAGSDIPEGELIIRKGARIGPRELAVISSLGISRLTVRGKIRIGIVSTGDELAEPGTDLLKGMIYESNSRTIKSLIDQEGSPFDVRLYSRLPDVEDTIRSKLDQYSSENDILIVSGSTSAGEKDMVYRILGEYSPGIVFHGIRIKPGKPTLLSKKGSRIVIGLPGFPVSAMMTFLTIFFPHILREAGLTSEEHYLEGTLTGKVSIDVGRLNLVPVSIVRKDRVYAFPIYGGSGSISRILRADGYISLEGDRRTADEGENVRITLFSPNPAHFPYVLAGEYDSVMDALSARSDLKIIKTGHFGALNSIAKGYSDAAGLVSSSEILDSVDLPASFSNGRIASLCRIREDIGIITPVGSPEIKDLNALVESQNIVAIPGKGEGAYRVIDEILSSSGTDLEEFHSRTSEVGNFNSVSYAVSEGYYSAGLSNRKTAENYGISFTPIGTYYYHIACLETRKGELKFLADGF